MFPCSNDVTMTFPLYSQHVHMLFSNVFPLFTCHLPKLGSYFKPDLILQVSLPRFHIGQSVVVHPHLSHNGFPMDGARVRAGSYKLLNNMYYFPYGNYIIS